MTTPSAQVLLTTWCLLVAMPAHGQTASARPLRIVVAAPPSSPADEQIRALAPAMESALGRVLLVDNRGGGQGIPASEVVARAEPNGGTILLGNSVTHGANSALHERLPYDPLRDFVPITQLARTSMVVVGHPRLPGTSMDELTSHARSNTAPLKLGSFDPVAQAAGLALARHLGFKLQPVMHPASIPAMLALTSGAVDLSLLTPLGARAHVHAGRLKAYAVTAASRSSLLPEIATLAEQGIEGYDFPCWDGLFAPAGTPAESVTAIHRSVVQALAAPRIRGLYLELGVTPIGGTPAELAAVVKRDIATFRRIADSKTMKPW